jgi:hypothetical protein
MCAFYVLFSPLIFVALILSSFLLSNSGLITTSKQEQKMIALFQQNKTTNNHFIDSIVYIVACSPFIAQLIQPSLL